jgi:molybdate transport system permease protein
MHDVSSRHRRAIAGRIWSTTSLSLAASLLSLLLLPLLVLAAGVVTDPASMLVQLGHPVVRSALWLSLWTTSISLGIIIFSRLPLAWILARRTTGPITRLVETLVELPIVVPPAVIGVALLLTFGRQGFPGSILTQWGINLAFTPAAVIIAQTVVAAPFFVQSALAAFRRIDEEYFVVARSLSASAPQIFFRIALPIALPGIVSGAALAWARALGEFGATLLFAGNLPGRTQTLTLAVYAGLETDIELARTLSTILMFTGIGLLLGLRAVARWTELGPAPRP